MLFLRPLLRLSRNVLTVEAGEGKASQDEEEFEMQLSATSSSCWLRGRLLLWTLSKISRMPLLGPLEDPSDTVASIHQLRDTLECGLNVRPAALISILL